MSMARWFRTSSLIVLILALAPAVLAQWVEFTNETATRLSATSNLVATDGNEKDYAWADIDRDGDLDMAIVRKQNFTSPGKRANVLLMNINGVLTDRTGDFAVAGNAPGGSDQGFLTPTNDRDVIFVDVQVKLQAMEENFFESC